MKSRNKSLVSDIIGKVKEEYPPLWEVMEFCPSAVVGNSTIPLRKGAVLRTSRIGVAGIERLKAQGVQIKPFKG